MNFKTKYSDILVMSLTILIAAVCIFATCRNNNMSTIPTPMKVTFSGEYSYDGENWYPLEENTQLSASRGNVQLKGHFNEIMDEEAALNFYKNHIGVDIYINGELDYMDIIAEINKYNIDITPSMCGSMWETVVLPYITPEDEVVINLTNTHNFGNSNAYNDFLDTLCSGAKDNILLEKNVKPYGSTYRVAGALAAILSLVIFGSAISAMVTHISEGKRILKMGLITLCMGGYIAFDTIDAFFWSGQVALNTSMVCICFMLAVHFTGDTVCEFLTGKRRSMAQKLVFVSFLINAFCFIAAAARFMLVYDAFYLWSIFQFVFCPVMAVLCIVEYAYNEKRSRLMLVSGAVLFAAFLMDIIGVGETLISNGILLKASFGLLLMVHIVAAAKQIILNHQASIVAEKLRKELEESRISIMLSQIQPHFLYNSISAIQALCSQQPLKAKEALGEFALYLRGNINSLSSSTPIPFAKELEHVESYLALEKMRFEEQLNIVYDIQENHFFIPSLTLQPLVENSVKHGVFAKEEGGTVTISSYRRDDKIIVQVSDDGAGFDMNNVKNDDRIHIGIKNVSERLEKMVGGKLEIESRVGHGTTARIILEG